MEPKTAELWSKQDRHQGDRWRFFRAVAEVLDAQSVLYPGSYVDLAPSFVFDTVTYVDIDKRAARFFADLEGVLEIVADHQGPAEPDVTFIHADYTGRLDLPEEHFDLLVSLYGGFISEHCTQHLRIGGTLLVNASHGDAAMASIDPRYRLSGTIHARSGGYRVDTSQLDTYLIPKKPQVVTRESLHEAGRGIGYTRSPFAYLFTRVS
ncbi:MAG: class I SAM-dependent methyltransferase [Microthrixaceae bacterium]